MHRIALLLAFILSVSAFILSWGGSPLDDNVELIFLFILSVLIAFSFSSSKTIKEEHKKKESKDKQDRQRYRSQLLGMSDYHFSKEIDEILDIKI